MNDHGAFLERIRQEPNDDLHRLVYADYLDDCGQPERAMLIRFQCEQARLQAETDKLGAAERSREEYDLDKPAWRANRDRRLVLRDRINVLRDQGNALLARFGKNWFGWILDVLSISRRPAATIPEAIEMARGGRITYPPASEVRRCRVQRGFPDMVSCSALDWSLVGLDLMEKEPIQFVQFTDPPVSIEYRHVPTRRMEVGVLHIEGVARKLSADQQAWLVPNPMPWQLLTGNSGMHQLKSYPTREQMLADLRHATAGFVGSGRAILRASTAGGRPPAASTQPVSICRLEGLNSPILTTAAAPEDPNRYD
jgi:uncharacterized protein (TIGR02996 family)